MSNDSSRDLWDWTDLTVRIVAGIALPAVIFYFGYQLRTDRQQSRNAERIRRSMDHLTSPDWRER